jgi:hypothetical protein
LHLADSIGVACCRNRCMYIYVAAWGVEWRGYLECGVGIMTLPNLQASELRINIHPTAVTTGLNTSGPSSTREMAPRHSQGPDASTLGTV